MPEFPADVAQQLKILPKLTAPELRALWQQTFNRPQPKWVQKDFLVRALAYHFQEKVFGGLKPAARRQLLRYAEEVASKGDSITSLDKRRIKPGTRIVRQWKGETHLITALEQGFEYRSRRYKSLSEIARLITGTRWSGPAFFGLKRPVAPSNADSRAG
jgi:hypothetical protein